MSTNPFAGKWAADMWGMLARNDWVDMGGGHWNISGSSQPDTYGGALFDTKEQAEAYIAANRPAGPTPSQNAYEASLQAMGISPGELPMSAGQELTARVLQQHGIPLPSYLQGYAGGGGAAPLGGTPGVDIFPNLGALYLPNAQRPDGGLDFGRIDNWMQAPAQGGDPYQNTIAARFLARTQQASSEQQQQMLREFIKKVMLAGQQQKQPVSPGLVAAAMGRVVAS